MNNEEEKRWEELEKVELPLRIVRDDAGWIAILDAKGMSIGYLNEESIPMIIELLLKEIK